MNIKLNNIIESLKQFSKYGPYNDNENVISYFKSFGVSIITTLMAPLGIILTLLQIFTILIVKLLQFIYDKYVIANLNKELLRYGKELEEKEGLYKIYNLERNNDLLAPLKMDDDEKDYYLRFYYMVYENRFPDKTDLEKFIICFIYYYNRLNATLYLDDKLQCYSDRRRSIGDIYLICKYYYPNITIIDIIKTLSKLIDYGVLHSSRCNQIQKYVFTIGSNCYDGKLEFINMNYRKLVKLIK